MQIDIPKPCSENWAEMNATQRGAFCNKCAIDVIDFSEKTPLEVKETLKANMGKHLCGRFKKKQLNTLNTDYISWENQTVKVFQSKFLWACVLVFGMTLFAGCVNTNAQQDFSNYNTAIVLLGDSTNALNDSIKKDSIELIAPQAQEHIMGALVAPQIEDEIYELGEPAFIPETEILGEIEFIPEDTLTNCTLPKDDSTTNKPTLLPEHEFFKGKIALPTNFENYIEATTDSTAIPTIISTNTLDASVYPNPLQTFGNLTLNIKQTGNFNIQVFSLDGALLLDIFDGRLIAGVQTFEIDLTAFQSAIYLVRITSAEQKAVLKVSKID